MLPPSPRYRSDANRAETWPCAPTAARARACVASVSSATQSQYTTVPEDRHATATSCVLLAATDHVRDHAGPTAETASRETETLHVPKSSARVEALAVHSTETIETVVAALRAA